MVRMLRSRKGFDLQFNWIFVLIAGAVFLGFFFLVIRNQLGSADLDKSVSQQSDLGFLLRTSQGSRSSEKLIYLSGRFIFACEDGVSSFYSEGSNFIEQYNYLAVFSPNILDARDLIIKTDSLKAPFASMPLIYLSNRETEYLFISNTPQLTRLYAGLPENVSKSFLVGGVSSHQDKGFDSLIIVADSSNAFTVIGQTMDAFARRRYGDIHLVVVEPEGGVVGSYGRVLFYSYSDTGFNLDGESYYFTQEQLLGAVYSGIKDIYSCQFDKTADKLALMARLHSQRAVYLRNVYDSSADCNLRYSSIIVDLEEIASVASLSSVGYGESRRIFEASARIAKSNLELVEQTSCPPIY